MDQVQFKQVLEDLTIGSLVRIHHNGLFGKKHESEGFVSKLEPHGLNLRKEYPFQPLSRTWRARYTLAYILDFGPLKGGDFYQSKYFNHGDITDYEKL